ncbi:MAG TPA: permease [Candidatus Nanopelagicales bacterium]|nr:permease [Candidatus Nanopelagicales bacterium]
MSTQAVRIRPGLKDTARLVIAAAAWLVVFRLNGPFWDWLIYSALGLSPESAAGSALHFFGYDVVKITLLLVGIIFIVTVLRSFMSLERTRALLGGKREGAGNVMAAGLGVITPFCSCSAVPAFIGFVSAGVPIGVTMSFLIASPLVNEIAIGLLLGMFGLGPTLLYVAAGLTIAVVAGWILGRVHAERWVEPFVFQTTLRGEVVDDVSRLGWPDRVAMGREEVVSILRRIWPYLLVGIGVGAIIHGWVPVGFFTTYASADNPLGVMAAVLIGVPLYSNAAGVMPLVQSLYTAGIPMGTLLAFMMSVVALSVPELILLRRILKPPLIAIFVAVLALSITVVGYLFNLVLA